MAESLLKTVVIYTFILVTALALGTAFIFIPAYVHHIEGHVPGGFDSLYLSKYSPYNTIVVEIDYQPGMEPDSTAIAILQEKIELYSQKRVVMYLNQEIGYDEVPILISGNDLFDLTSRLKRAHRDYRTGWMGGNITLYIMYLDSVWQPDNSEYSSNMPAYQYMTGTRVYSAGVTYTADSIIIFRDALTQEGTETTILLHELGHVWGLDHSSTSGDVMSSEFDVYDSVPFSREPEVNQFPTNYSTEDVLRLAQLHESPLILPFLDTQ